jgi:hypothetical protein
MIKKCQHHGSGCTLLQNTRRLRQLAARRDSRLQTHIRLKDAGSVKEMLTLVQDIQSHYVISTGTTIKHIYKYWDYEK